MFIIHTSLFAAWFHLFSQFFSLYKAPPPSLSSRALIFQSSLSLSLTLCRTRLSLSLPLSLIKQKQSINQQYAFSYHSIPFSDPFPVTFLRLLLLYFPWITLRAVAVRTRTPSNTKRRTTPTSGEAPGPSRKTSLSSTTSPTTARAAGIPSPAVPVRAAFYDFNCFYISLIFFFWGGL